MHETANHDLAFNPLQVDLSPLFLPRQLPMPNREAVSLVLDCSCFNINIPQMNGSSSSYCFALLLSFLFITKLMVSGLI